MKRLSLLILAAFLSLSFLGIGTARAHGGNQDGRQAAAYVQSVAAIQANLAAHIELGDHRHGGEDDCAGVCSSCCAAACSATALTGTTGTSVRFLLGVPLQFAMASPGHGRKSSPPSPPPRS